MFSCRSYETSGEKLLAVCDADLLGKTLEEGDLSLFVSPEFYGGRIVGKEVLALARKSTIINAVGNKIVSLLIDNDMVSEKCVIKIKGVMHAQVVVVS
jgi:hypothetical protein